MKKELLITEDDVPLSEATSDEFDSRDLLFISNLRESSEKNLFHSDMNETLSFMERFFPEATLKNWDDWRWQLTNSITNISKLSEIIELNESERRALSGEETALPLRITPYYIKLLYQNKENDSLRRSVIPVIEETMKNSGEDDDPLSEDSVSPVPGIIHRYPDRVLFLATGFCSTYCRYCTRSRMVGDNKLHNFKPKTWEDALSYIERTPAIRDVLLSGGDPLTMTDSQLDYLLGRLRAIPHIEIIRIGSKVPAVLPQRITPKLVNILKKYHPLFLSLHFTHPDEITPETKLACKRLADAGIPLGSQTVLLKGINNNIKTMTSLFQNLLKIRVRPYYLYQCDPVSGSHHFRTSVQEGLDIIKGIRGHTSGYAVPHYVIDAPGGGGKIPVLPDYFTGRDDNFVYLKNYENKTFKYPDKI